MKSYRVGFRDRRKLNRLADLNYAIRCRIARELPRWRTRTCGSALNCLCWLASTGPGHPGVVAARHVRVRVRLEWCVPNRAARRGWRLVTETYLQMETGETYGRAGSPAEYA